MANFYLSANMSLPVPSVGIDPGPDWANNVNASLTLIDSHDHSSGKGVPITPAGINISTDLSFNSNNLISARSLRMNSQNAVLSLPADLDCLYVVGADLYYNDGNGNNVRITQSGGVAGSPGSISNLTSPASAAYVSASSTFVWESAANTPANLDAGSVIFRNITANSNGITLSAPNSLASNYTLTLPAIPGSTMAVSIDSSGNLGTSAIPGSQLQAQTVAQGALALRTTGTTVAAGGVAISLSSGSDSTTSSTPVLIANQSITITTTGRPVEVRLSVSGASSGGFLQIPTSTALISIVRDGSNIVDINVGAGGFSGTVLLPPSAVAVLDTGATAATHTYAVAWSTLGGTISCKDIVLVAYEI